MKIKPEELRANDETECSKKSCAPFLAEKA